MTHDLEIVGLNPNTVCWIDVTFFALIFVDTVSFVWKDRKYAKKEAGELAHFSKIGSWSRNENLKWLLNSAKDLTTFAVQKEDKVGRAPPWSLILPDRSFEVVVVKASFCNHSKTHFLSSTKLKPLFVTGYFCLESM